MLLTEKANNNNNSVIIVYSGAPGTSLLGDGVRDIVRLGYQRYYIRINIGWADRAVVERETLGPFLPLVYLLQYIFT